MARSLPRPDVDRLARLARLDLTEAECDLFARQLGDILALAEQVQSVPARDHQPPAATSGSAPLRPDVSQPSLPREAALAAAPGGVTAAGLFKVPRVLA